MTKSTAGLIPGLPLIVVLMWGGGDVSVAADCEAYCGCLADTCSMVEGYPYGERSECLAACEAFSSEEASCWPNFCAEAQKIRDKTPVHLCEHAWGKLGMKECEKVSD